MAEREDVLHITSVTNSRIKRLVRLRSRRARDEEGVFVAEGHYLHRAVAAGMVPLEVYGPTTDPIVEGGTRYRVSGPALAKASYRSDDDAVIGVFQQTKRQLDDIDLGPNPLVVVADALEKPGNVGAILRTAAALEVDLVLVPTDFDLYNPNVIRSSIGALFIVPVVGANLGTSLRWLTAHGVSIVAADPIGGAAPWEVDLKGGVAVVVGEEHSGLGELARSSADVTVSIPMTRGVDSLNASVTSALLMYEALRQRADQ